MKKKIIIYSFTLILFSILVYAAIPVINTVTITPTTAYTNTTLLIYCNSTDSDGDNITYNYQVYRNDTLYKTNNLQNQTHSLINWYNFTTKPTDQGEKAFDNNFTTYTEYTSPTGEVAFYNITKKINGTTEIKTIKFNIQISDNKTGIQTSQINFYCVKTSPQSVKFVTGQTGNGTYNTPYNYTIELNRTTYHECIDLYNESIIIGVSSGGVLNTGSRLYEIYDQEIILTNESGGQKNLINISTTEFSKGDNFTAECRTTDDNAQNWTTWTNSTTKIISDYPTITLNNSQTNNYTQYHIYNVTFGANDIDGANDINNLTWINSSGNCTNNYNETGSLDINFTIECTGTALQENELNITITDNQGTTINYTLNNTYPNNIPEINNQTITDNTTFLDCTYDYSDNDTDTRNETQYAWYKNNASLNITTQTLLSGNYTTNDELICQITTADTYQYSTPENTTIFRVGDITPPTLNGENIPATGFTDTSLNIDIDCTDADSGISIGYPQVEWKNPYGATEGNHTMTLVTGNTYRKTYLFNIVGTYSNFKYSCKDGSGNLQTLNLTNSLTITTRPVVGGGGGGGTPIDTKEECDINIPEQITITNKNTPTPITITNKHASTYQPSINQKPIITGLSITNPTITLLPGQTTQTGLIYNGEKNQTNTTITFISNNCKDINTKIIINIGSQTNPLETYTNKDITEILQEPILPGNLGQKTPYFNHATLYILTLLILLYANKKQFTKNQTNKKSGSTIALLILLLTLNTIIVIFSKFLFEQILGGIL